MSVQISSVLIIEAAFCFGLTAAWYNFLIIENIQLALYIIIILFNSFLVLSFIISRSKITQSIRTRYSRVKEKSAFINNIVTDLKLDQEIIEKTTDGLRIRKLSNHKLYSNFNQIKIVYDDAHKAYRLAMHLRNNIALSLDVKRRDRIYSQKKSEFSVPILDNVYILDSSTPEIWQNLFKINHLKENLLMLRPHLEYLSLKGNTIEVLIKPDKKSSKTITKLLDWILSLDPSMRTLSEDSDISRAELLLCYNCQETFDPLEEVCNKCQSPRPRCIICFQELKPAEDEDVVILPCCKIYAHKKHMISWLKQKTSCPNCHLDLGKWLNQLII
ncbi:MAG: E3 ubiquitin protein ligase [Asgard group archaeon]|nr:E3 ubiquitin protein ligase [Asgard group archaeon]